MRKLSLFIATSLDGYIAKPNDDLSFLKLVEKEGEDYGYAKFSDELISRMVFSQHNLIIDGSFNEFDLILCRNVLIYFDRELQHKALMLFDNSLEKLGYLALGSKETIYFSPIAKRYQKIDNEKIYKKLYL